MSNQLHRRLAYRTGGTGTDTTSDSFWDSSDFSTAHIVSSMYLYKKYMGYSGSGTDASPWRLSPMNEANYMPGWGCPEALFLTGGTDPILMFSATARGISASGDVIDLGNMWRAHSFVGSGDRLAANPISGNVDARCNQPMYQDGDSPSTVSWLCTGCVARDHSGVHWYFLQRGNATGNYYKNCGYIPAKNTNIPTTHQNQGGSGTGYQTVNINTNYGVRVLHFATPSGGYPLEAERTAMVTSTKEPGTYTYYSGTGTTPYTNNAAVGVMNASGNRQAWDFTLLALESRDFSPEGYFTGNAPICMQCVDSGQKMAFLSAITTNGQALSFRSMTSPWDITTLSTTTTERAMTDFQAAVCDAVGASSTWIQWTWFKFSTDGKKLILVSHCGLVAKFRMTNAYDLATLALVTAVRLPSSVPSVNPPTRFSWSGQSASTYDGNSSYIKNPIVAVDIDPDGQSLMLTVNNTRSNNWSGQPPYSHALIQYRL